MGRYRQQEKVMMRAADRLVRAVVERGWQPPRRKEDQIETYIRKMTERRKNGRRKRIAFPKR